MGQQELDPEVKEFIKILVSEYGGTGSEETYDKICKVSLEPITKAVDESPLVNAFLEKELTSNESAVTANDRDALKVAIRTLLIQTIHHQIMMVAKSDSLGLKDECLIFPNFDSLIAQAKAYNYPATTEDDKVPPKALKLSLRM